MPEKKSTYNFLALYKRLTVNPSGYLQNLEFRVCSRFEFQIAYLNQSTHQKTAYLKSVPIPYSDSQMSRSKIGHIFRESNQNGQIMS